MAPVSRANKAECGTVEEEYYGIKGDRKVMTVTVPVGDLAQSL